MVAMKVMGILNVTPDSFSDGGLYLASDKAIRHAETMIAAGANIIDIGGESSRPYSEKLSLAAELDRVIPIIEKLKQITDIPISIDTYKPPVMVAAIKAGATMINDIKALQEEGALTIAKNSGVDVCLMHMQGSPQTMQMAPQYHDVVTDVFNFLSDRVTACLAVGINKKQIFIDPGFGFGKTIDHNLSLLQQLEKFRTIECSILVGLSRKAFIGAITNESLPQERMAGSLAASIIAMLRGATVIRTHDVKAVVQAKKIIEAVL